MRNQRKRAARRLIVALLIVCSAFGVSWAALPTDLRPPNISGVVLAIYFFVVITGVSSVFLWALRPIVPRRSLKAATPPQPADANLQPRRDFDPARLEEVPHQAVQLWRHYEDVAMHFNELIMRWRLQAIGGLVALITASGFIVGGAEDLGVRYRAMLLLSLTLLFGWTAVACIDLMYYRRLLVGSVDALLRLERQLPDVQLSTFIERHAYSGGKWAPRLFYLIGAVPLVVLITWALINLLGNSALQPPV